jgi:uncharacterized protein involved in exopolysaccharide biosynthesis
MVRHGLIASALCAALLAAGCGTSPEDTAHDNGKAVGRALRSMSDAQSTEELRAGAKDLRDAVGDVSDTVSSRVRAQVRAQQNNINKAIGDARQALTSTNPETATSARDQLQGELQDLRSQAASFDNTRNSVTNSFWAGVKDGYDDG